jgi:probable phosphoglycerate mutase
MEDMQDTDAYPQTRFAPPAGATDLLLVRHGESAPLPASGDFPRLDGHADPELTAAGRRQAELLADRLQRAGIDAIYTSTLRRTVQTAAPLAGRLGLEPITEPGLREVFLGEWEGGMFRKLESERSELTARVWRDGTWDLVPGAESSDGFATRVRDAVERICGANPGRRVLVVAHGGVIGQVIASATAANALAFVRCDNASISHLVVHGDLWIVRRFNDTAHLGPTFSATAAPPT